MLEERRMNDIEMAIETLKDMKGVFDTRGHKQYSLSALDLAIAALEKQIPKKPCEVVDESGWEDWACPECRALIEGGSVMLHCWSCGQKLDWSVGE